MYTNSFKPQERKINNLCFWDREIQNVFIGKQIFNLLANKH